jgi:hypothetical protein
MQFHCEICNVSFKAKQTLERHLQSTRHLAVLYDKDNEFHFVCECGKKYVHKQSLVLHQKHASIYNPQNKTHSVFLQMNSRH